MYIYLYFSNASIFDLVIMSPHSLLGSRRRPMVILGPKPLTHLATHLTTLTTQMSCLGSRLGLGFLFPQLHIEGLLLFRRECLLESFFDPSPAAPGKRL